jgi:hypothetical protein
VVYAIASRLFHQPCSVDRAIQPPRPCGYKVSALPSWIGRASVWSVAEFLLLQPRRGDGHPLRNESFSYARTSGNWTGWRSRLSARAKLRLRFCRYNEARLDCNDLGQPLAKALLWRPRR